MITNYQEALENLYTNLPIFQRVGAAALRPDLTNTRVLCEALGNPQAKFKSVHVGGTNGKGSTSHLLASILQTAGYKTGLYTSPHLKSFTERIKVNGQEVSEHFVVDFVTKITPLINQLKPSFFEITVAMAFDYFASQQIDIAIVEVGLGGKLDSTNIINPLVSVITNIGWDHKDLLGDTLPKIASEKAGIIKPNIPVVISERQPNVADVFIKKASETTSDLYFASDVYAVDYRMESGYTYFSIKRNNKSFIENILIPLQGIYQKKNLPGVFKVLDILETKGFFVSTEALRNGLQNVVALTGLKGRWQKLNDSPMMICDTGHNIDGIREVIYQIGQYQYDALYIVLGMVKDKDITAVLELLPKDAYYYFCQANIPRALDAESLCAKAKEVGLRGEVVPDVNKAKTIALQRATANDFIFIGGSTFVVAEIEEL
jgi:dihydrofolate synthase/folylpolyglutamate synthase